MRSLLCLGIVAACLAGSGAVRAGDAPVPVPRPLPTIDHPFLTWLTGTWAIEKQEPMLDEMPVGTRTFGPGLGGTAVFSEYTRPDGDGAYEVLRVAADGQTVRRWAFAPTSRAMGLYAPIESSGPLKKSGFDLAPANVPSLVERWSRAGESLVTDFWIEGKSVAVQTWRRTSATRADLEFKEGALAAHPLVRSLLGEWAVRATANTGVAAEGTTRFRLVAGGEFLTQRSAAKGPDASTEVHVWTLRDDGTTLHGWHFTRDAPAPVALDGKATATGWSVSFEGPTGVRIEIALRKTDSGFSSTWSVSAFELMTQTWVRAAPPK